MHRRAVRVLRIPTGPRWLFGAQQRARLERRKGHGWLCAFGVKNNNEIMRERVCFSLI